MFRKPSAGNTLLHASSFHPLPLVQSSPHSQYLKVRRNCSSEDEFKVESDKLRIRLLERVYTKSTLRKAFNRVNSKARQEALLSNRVRDENPPQMRFITKFSSQHQQVRHIQRTHWGLLLADDKVTKHLSPYPQITFRKSQSIRDKLVSRHYVGEGRKDPCKKNMGPLHVAGAHTASTLAWECKLTYLMGPPVPRGTLSIARP